MWLDSIRSAKRKAECLVVKALNWVSRDMASILGSATDSLWDLGQVPLSVCASVPCLYNAGE